MTTQTTELQTLYEETAREFARRVRGRFPREVHSIVLYGSVARGTATEDSDVDVLVLAEDAEGLESHMGDIGFELTEEYGYRTHVSSLEMTLHHLEELRRGGFPIAGHVIEEGVVLYDDGTFARWKELGPMTTPGEEYIKDRLALAAEMLRDAKNMLNQEGWRSAVDRGYYAIFHSAEAAVAMYGVEPARTHDGLRSQFGEHLVKAGIVEKRFSKDLSDAHELRLKATYEASAKLDRVTAEATVAKAEQFVERVKELARDRGL